MIGNYPSSEGLVEVAFQSSKAPPAFRARRLLAERTMPNEDEEALDEASRESFPCSDAPPWTLSGIGSPRRRADVPTEARRPAPSAAPDRAPLTAEPPKGAGR